MDDVKGFRPRPGSAKVNLGLICALQEECRHILHWGGWKSLRPHRGSTPSYGKEEGELRLRLVVSGMGGVRASTAVKELLEGFAPNWVICFGFAGALEESLRVGDLIWGKGVARWEEGRGLSPWRRLADAPSRLVPSRSDRFAFREGWLVSVDGLSSKKDVLGVAGPDSGPAVMEMETYSLSLALEPLGIPLGAIRAVSDESGLDAGAGVKRWMDDTLRLRPSMLIADLARHPLRINLVLKLSLRSRVASRSLALGLRAVLEAVKGCR